MMRYNGYIRFIKINIMTELIDKLKAQAGLSSEQAAQSLEVIKNFVKEKFPMLAGAVDNIFGAEVNQAAAVMHEGTTAAAETAKEESGWLDKISDIIPGELGEKIEGYAKKAADTAEDAFEKAKDSAEDLIAKGKSKFDDLARKN